MNRSVTAMTGPTTSQLQGPLENSEGDASKSSPRSRLAGLVEITRPANSIIGSLTVVIGILNGVEVIAGFFSTMQGWLVLGIAITTYMFTAFGSNVINDYFDVEIDKINRPGRPIPRGAVTKTGAFRYFFLLGGISTATCLSFAWITPNWLLIVLSNLFFLFVSFLYAWKGKASGFPGNIMVGVSYSFGIPFGAMFVVPVLDMPVIVWSFFATSALLLVSRELVKGMEDIEGDLQFNIKTVAGVLGHKVAAVMSASFSVAAIVSFTLPVFFLPVNAGYIVFMIAGNVFVVVSVVVLAKSHMAPKNQSRASLFLKAGAFTGLVAYVLASLF